MDLIKVKVKVRIRVRSEGRAKVRGLIKAYGLD